MKKKLKSNLLFLVWFVSSPFSLLSLSVLAVCSMPFFFFSPISRHFPGQVLFSVIFFFLYRILSSRRILLSSFFCSKYISYPSMASLFNQDFSLLLCLSSSLITVPPARLSSPALVLGKVAFHFLLSFSLCIHLLHPSPAPHPFPSPSHPIAKTGLWGPVARPSSGSLVL